MSRMLFGQDATVADWVAERIPHVDGAFRDCAAIGVADEAGRILGGVVYHDYRGNDVQMSLAGTPGWLSRSALTVFFRYPFAQLGCDRVTCFVPARNIRTRAFCEKFGFTQEGVIRRGFAVPTPDDCIVYGLLHEECKFLKDSRHG